MFKLKIKYIILISSLNPIWRCTYTWLFLKKPLHPLHSTHLFKIFFLLLTLSTAFLQKACGPGKNEVYSFRKQVPLTHSLRPKATAHFVIYESCRTVKSSLCMKKFSLTDVKNTRNKNTYNISTCNSSTCNSSKCNNNTCENNTCNSNKCNNNTSNIAIKRELVTLITITRVTIARAMVRIWLTKWSVLYQSCRCLLELFLRPLQIVNFLFLLI